MKIEHDGVKIDLEFDGDGFPLITIDLDGFTSELYRPTVDVVLNGVTIHEMFDLEDNKDSKDDRWNK